MYDVLQGMRAVEGSSFIAAPLCGLYLTQLGAEVIRFDQIGGGPDYHRWPLAPGTDASLYWEGLNAGKKSIAIDLHKPEGRELAQRLVTAPGQGGGLFVTNYPLDGFLAHQRLAALRPDLITVRVMGQANGLPALDYTVNCALGIPQITGPADLGERPVNHVLPAWDLLTGAYAAFALLAAERRRGQSGQGQEVRVPLADLGVSSVATLGMLAEALASGAARARYGNDVFGAFGRDFLTADRQRIMVMAMTPRQWRGLLEALELRTEVAQIEQECGVSFERDEGLRFKFRERLIPAVASAIAARTLATLQPLFDRLGVCWSPYLTTLEAARDPALVGQNPIFSRIRQHSGLSYPVSGAPATLPHAERHAPRRAPGLGEHTEEVLAQVLNLSSGEIGRLHDAAVVAGPLRP